MNATITANKNADCLEITGTITIDTIAHLRQTGSALLKKTQAASCNLQGVTKYDSSALALLTALTRDAKQLGKQMSFLNIPPQLLEIAKLSNLDKVLKLEV